MKNEEKPALKLSTGKNVELKSGGSAEEKGVGGSVRGRGSSQM